MGWKMLRGNDAVKVLNGVCREPWGKYGQSVVRELQLVQQE